LLLTKTGPGTVSAGGLVTYTLQLVNLGPAAADGATITDALPGALSSPQLTACTAAAGASCPVLTLPQAIAGTLSLSVPALPSGGTVTLTVTGTAPAVNASFTNLAVVAPPPTTSDPNSGNNIGGAVGTGVAANADLAVVKSGTASAASNGAVSYTLAVTNGGPAAADGAVVTDPAVANFTATSVTCGSPSGGAVCPTVGQHDNSVAARAQGIVIPTLPSGGGVTFTLNGTAAASGSISNVASVAPPAGITDPTPGNDSSNASTTITATIADLALAKSGPASVASNGAVSYTLVVTNAGAASAGWRCGLRSGSGELHGDERHLRFTERRRGVPDGGQHDSRVAARRGDRDPDAAVGRKRDLHAQRNRWSKRVDLERRERGDSGRDRRSDTGQQQQHRRPRRSRRSPRRRPISRS
jgi:uncharacterized repeat protein (TIGR01451 family)